MHSMPLTFSAPTVPHAPFRCSSCMVTCTWNPSACLVRSQQRRPHAAAAQADTPAPTASVSADLLASNLWNTHQRLQVLHHQRHLQSDLPNTISEHSADSTLFLTAELRLLANAASDRAEMHSILAHQRDNWNKLFQRMLTSAALTACMLSALAGHSGQSLGLSLPALLLNAATAAMMAIINQFQPSQLAEEQRTAARLFRKLASDIQYALNVSPDLCQSTASFFDDCKRRLRALDKAFPMPLTPGGLEKFPAKVVPPTLSEPRMTHGDDIDQQAQCASDDGRIKGWDRHLADDLKHVAATLRRSDIRKHTLWAQNLVKVNKCLAIAAPCFAILGAALNLVTIASAPAAAAPATSMWAAICGVIATFVNSFSNDMQMGMVVELYRNSAGYYADVETTIRDTLCMPAQHREHGTLFRHRIAYQLGRWPVSNVECLLPPDASEGGTLF